MAVDKIALCNLALGQLPSDAITDFEEPSTEAEWSARLYGPTLGYCLDLHDWKFPRKRVALAEVTNDRAGEWGYAYAFPDDCISELRVLPTFDGSFPGIAPFGGLALSSAMISGLPTPLPYRFLVSGSTLYSSLDQAVLEYITTDPNAQTFRPQFARAFVDELAARLVMPVRKDRVRQGDLMKIAEMSMARAIADEINRDDSQSTYGDIVNETEIARGGGSALGFYQ